MFGNLVFESLDQLQGPIKGHLMLLTHKVRESKVLPPDTVVFHLSEGNVSTGTLVTRMYNIKKPKNHTILVNA
jgi:hypothetical protein